MTIHEGVTPDSAPPASSVELLSEALRLWQTITGVNPEAKSFKFGDWDLKRTFDELKEALEYDPAGITAELLLTYFVNNYLADNVISIEEMMNNPEGVAARLKPIRRIKEILNEPSLIDARDAFIKNLRQALEKYDAAQRPDVIKFLEQPDNIAILRRDALRSVTKLQVNQFLRGDSESPVVKPVYAKVVHQWWNVNSLLENAVHMPSGVSLNLIRHPDGYQSYFVFVIRNGGNLFVLTDIESYSHPLQGSMSRRPDRDLDKRASKNWFPYELLGLDYDEESGKAYIKASSERGLVAKQVDARPLSLISDLKPPELVWVSMMFDLIIEKFWRQGYQSKALSYTAEMLKVDRVLADSAKTANLPVSRYQSVGLSPLEVKDVLSESVSEKEVGTKYNNPNAWLEERFAHKVKAESLNLVLPGEKIMALTHEGEIKQLKKLDGAFAMEALIKKHTKLEQVDVSSFGTREKLSQDRLFIARHNLAGQIDAMAKEEYKLRHEEVRSWFAKKVKENVKNLEGFLAHEAIWINDGLSGAFSGYEGSVPARSVTVGKDSNMIVRALSKRYDTSESSEYSWHLYGAIKMGIVKDGVPLCYFKQTKGNYRIMFSPASAKDLAWLAGCEVDELPDVLQHWTVLRPYRGNCILDRIDPMVWHLQDPWQKLDLRVLFTLSKRGLAEAEKIKLSPETLRGFYSSKNSGLI